jgi:hypothetical protein
MIEASLAGRGGSESNQIRPINTCLPSDSRNTASWHRQFDDRPRNGAIERRGDPICGAGRACPHKPTTSRAPAGQGYRDLPAGGMAKPRRAVQRLRAQACHMVCIPVRSRLSLPLRSRWGRWLEASTGNTGGGRSTPETQPGHAMFSATNSKSVAIDRQNDKPRSIGD